MISDLIEVGLGCVVLVLFVDNDGTLNCGHDQLLLLSRGEKGFN
jgi:hypothetical protein